jgi:hypothetical protein
MGIEADILGRVANFGFIHNLNKDFYESFRPDHIKSKKWLVHEICKHNTVNTGEYKLVKKINRVAVLGSWNSVLLKELLESRTSVEHWDFYDINHSCHRDRDVYHEVNQLQRNYTYIEEDVTKLFAHEDVHKQYDLIINPSCEHMADIKAVKGPMYALTSNNYKGIKGHINTISKHEELAVKNGINNIAYEGSLKLTNYTRYCTIGSVK